MKGWGETAETKEPAPELGKEARPGWARGEKTGQERKRVELDRFLRDLHRLLRLASLLPAGSPDLSSLSLAVSRTTGEQPSPVPAHLHSQDRGGGNPLGTAFLDGVLPCSSTWGFQMPLPPD